MTGVFVAIAPRQPEAGGCARLARLDDGALDWIDHAWVTGFAAPLQRCHDMGKPASVVEGWVRVGYDDRLASGTRVVQRLGAVLSLLPRTSALGAMRRTGHHGGATAIHVRVSEPCVAPIVLGQLVWEGLFRRDERRRVLLPW